MLQLLVRLRHVIAGSVRQRYLTSVATPPWSTGFIARQVPHFVGLDDSAMTAAMRLDAHAATRVGMQELRRVLSRQVRRRCFLSLER